MYFKIFILINFIFNGGTKYGSVLGVTAIRIGSCPRFWSREASSEREVDHTASAALRGDDLREYEIKQPKFKKIDICNCTISKWYINQCGKLKRYLSENKEALYM